MSGYAHDCVHLHACRRMAVIYRNAKSTNASIARYCTFDCSAYEAPAESTAPGLKDIVRAGELVKQGWDPYEAAVEVAYGKD